MLRTTSILERLAALLVGGTPLFAQSRSTPPVAARFPGSLASPPNHRTPARATLFHPSYFRFGAHAFRARGRLTRRFCGLSRTFFSADMLNAR